MRLAIVALIALLTTVTASARSPFDGRWRIDTSTMAYAARPKSFSLKGDLFTMGGDADGVRADGAFHPSDGKGYIDAQSITIVDPHHVREVDRNRGKTVYIVDYGVSADGALLTMSVTSFANVTGEAVHSETRLHRIGQPRKGEHLLSGDWLLAKLSVDAASDWLLTLENNRFSWRSLQGSGYEAIIGGPRVRIDGDQSGAFAAITMPRSDTVVETDSAADGKQDAVMTLTILPDGKTIKAVAAPSEGPHSTFTLRKQ